MTAFIVIGIVGAVIIVGSLIFDFTEGMFDALDIDSGSGLFSVPVMGAFLTAFGFGGALTMSALGGAVLAGLAGGLGAGLAMGAAALAITRSLMNMRTDEPVRLSDVVGKTATVVTRIPDAGLGEVSLVHLGQRMKLNARADGAIPAGTSVVVTAVTSASSVMVEAEHTFWQSNRELGGS